MVLKKGILLINVGTPSEPTTPAVRRYLKSFLDDPRVIDLPWLLRKCLLHFVILPFRSAKSANAYQTIWDSKQGSPLFYNMKALTNALQNHVGEDYRVELGMRYGEPEIEKGIQNLIAHGCDHVYLIPLYPQYSSAATASAIEHSLLALKNKLNLPNLSVLNAFYDHPEFLDAMSARIKPFIYDHIDKVVFSYHSLPWRQIKKSAHCHTQCAQNLPCGPVETKNAYCYRAQCYATAKALSCSLQVQEKYEVVFQSKIGKNPWVGPDLIASMPQWIKAGNRHLLIACPSFVVDCLETLEEIGIRAKASWLSLGGESFTLVPCLNDEPYWVSRLAKMITAL